MDRLKRSILTLAGLAALALGGSGIANAASNSAATRRPQRRPGSVAGLRRAASGRPRRARAARPGRHVGANGTEEQALSQGRGRCRYHR
jgi:hypothetical protein